MPRLFGLDVARMVSDALDAAGGVQSGELIRDGAGVRDPANPTAGVVAAETRHSFRGFYEVREVRRPGTLVRETTPVLTIIGASLPSGVEPAVNDKAQLGGMTWQLVRLISRDPASAVYEFEAS